MTQKTWKCKKCGQIVIAGSPPVLKWDDGHVCEFVEEKEKDGEK